MLSSSVSVNESLSDPTDAAAAARYNNGPRRGRTHSRTKSMPSNVNEFLQSYASNCNNSNQYYERSKSAEVLNHLGEQSAFSIYDEENDEGTQHLETSLLDLDEEEIFIDSPLVVDYQLGRRRSLPVSPATSASISPTADRHSRATSTSSDRSCTGYDNHDEEVTEALQGQATQQPGYQSVRAEPVTLGTPGVPERSSVVHATPVVLGTPCRLSKAMVEEEEVEEDRQSPLLVTDYQVGLLY